MLAQNVAGRDLAIAEALLENLGLRAFAGSRRARRRSRGSFLDEPAVVAHRKTRFDLRDRIQRHADDDQQRRRTEVELRDAVSRCSDGSTASRPR